MSFYIELMKNIDDIIKKKYWTAWLEFRKFLILREFQNLKYNLFSHTNLEFSTGKP